MSVIDVRSYPEAIRTFSWAALWELFDGNRERLNLAHECVDRHAGKGKIGRASCRERV